MVSMPEDFIEVLIDEAIVERLVAEQFPQWAALPVARAVEFGTDNAMFRLGDSLAARLPRFAARAEQVGNICKGLPVLAPHLAVAIPVPLARGRPGAGYPFDWSIVPWLSGDEATLDRVPDETRFAGDLVDMLHSLGEVDAIRGPVPLGRRARAAPGFACRFGRRRMAGARAHRRARRSV